MNRYIKLSATLDERGESAGTRLAVIVAQLVREGLTFEVTESRGSYGELQYLITLTGGY